MSLPEELFPGVPWEVHDEDGDFVAKLGAAWAMLQQTGNDEFTAMFLDAYQCDGTLEESIAFLRHAVTEHRDELNRIAPPEMRRHVDTESWYHARDWLMEHAPKHVLEYCDYLLSAPVVVPEQGAES